MKAEAESIQRTLWFPVNTNFIAGEVQLLCAFLQKGVQQYLEMYVVVVAARRCFCVPDFCLLTAGRSKFRMKGTHGTHTEEGTGVSAPCTGQPKVAGSCFGA